MKKTKYIGFRVLETEFALLEVVREHIAADARGIKPEITDIIRSLIGFGNQSLVSNEERDYLAGKITSLEEVGQHAERHGTAKAKQDSRPARYVLSRSGRELVKG